MSESQSEKRVIVKSTFVVTTTLYHANSHQMRLSSGLERVISPRVSDILPFTSMPKRKLTQRASIAGTFKSLNISKILFFSLLFYGHFFMAESLQAKGDFEHPNSFIGNAGWSKGLELWIEVGDVSLGEGVTLPFRLQFTSDAKGESALFGNPWWAPLLESREKNAGHYREFTTL